MNKIYLLKQFKHSDPAGMDIQQYPDGYLFVMGRGGLQFSIREQCTETTVRKEYNFTLPQLASCCRIGNLGYVFNFPDNSCYVVIFAAPEAIHEFHQLVEDAKKEVESGLKSTFSTRTEETSASQYFQFYGYLSQQQNMLQDYIRTSTYERAVMANTKDFQGKVILDVGAGSGILSFFAAQAGAAKVYAVEASSMAEHAEKLTLSNNFSDKITLIAGKVEEINLPEKVDLIISEPMGYMLYNERMLETYLHAKKWLKDGGQMFPTLGDLHIAPFMDEALFIEQTGKAGFWQQTHFHNVNLTSLHEAAMTEYFRQPVVDTFDVRICVAKPIKHTLNFLQADEKDLYKINIPLKYEILSSGTIHGLAFWFDVAFEGSEQTIWLSTAPTEPLTHWYQVRCLLRTPILVMAGQKMVGSVILEANTRQSYDVHIDLMVEGMPATRSKNSLDLKNPYFRYTGQSVVPAGHNTTSPTDYYWTQMEAQSAVNMRQNAEVTASPAAFDMSQWSTTGQTAPHHTINTMVNGITLNGFNGIQMDPAHQADGYATGLASHNQMDLTTSTVNTQQQSVPMHHVLNHYVTSQPAGNSGYDARQ